MNDENLRQHHCEPFTAQTGAYSPRADGTSRGVAITEIVWADGEWAAMQADEGFWSAPIFFCPFCGIKLEAPELS